jgi:type IV pilus assembly protein PilW
MKYNIKRNISHQAGFTLVEIMIGLVIGMLVAMVIVQVLSMFEGQKRATTGTADAQTNGSIALYNIERELQLAGYPLMPSGQPGVADSPMECTTVTYGATGITSISPVSILDGVAGANPASDQITLHYGTSQSGGVPSQIGAVAGNTVTLGTAISPGSNFGCQVNDITIVTNGGTCALSSVTALSAAGVLPITATLQNITAAVNGASFACLGPVWNEVVYSVVNGNLVRSLNGAAPVPVVAGIVNLQAQYGISATTNSNQIVAWVDASGATWAAPTVANRNRIKAIRVAIIARNTKMEPNAVTTACSSTTAASPTGLCAWEGVAAVAPITTASPAPAIDLSPGNANWAKYHYRVFETIIPLRNVIWSKATL